VIADLSGKAKRVRTVPIPIWVKTAIDTWTTASGITDGKLFRRINRNGKIWGERITAKTVWHVVKTAAKQAALPNIALHDLRRTCARLCHQSGGELEQIQFLLGHASVQTTERYLGCKQKLRRAVNDRMGLEIN
jgi:integrase